MSRFVTSTAAASAVLLSAAPAIAWFACQDGPAAGDWLLPQTSGGSDGWMDGKLIDPVLNQGIYAVSAVLTDVPSPCLSCVQGTISGTLDDGVGVGPDYYLVGEYSGQWLSGQGTYWAKIVPPGSNTSVGLVWGDFADAPGTPGHGSFDGRWEICP